MASYNILPPNKKKEKLKIIALQTDIAWADPTENHRRAEQMLSDISEQADLIVLPEMFSTGFATQPDGIAEQDAQPSLDWMRSLARRHNCAVAGSVATQTDGKYRNRFFFVTPDGEEQHYDKHHLFTYGGEHLRYTAGKERRVVCWRGVRILLQVCYDLRFPCFSRNQGDYDMAIYVASWPTTRVKAWSALLRARAIENQCYVLGLNRVGSDPQCQYPGASAFIDPYGETLAEADDRETALSATIDMEQLNAFREKFPVLNDRD